MKHSNFTLGLLLLLSVTTLFAQESEETQNEKSNIQNYTPSKLLEVGKWDIKWFNNLYTETKEADANGNVKPRAKGRQSFFNTSLEVFTGVTKSKWLNVGVIAEFRSNTFANRHTLSVFKFGNEKGLGRSGLGHVAPSIKVAPLKSVSNFSFQSSFFIPTHDVESTHGSDYLTEKSYIWQNRFFYDHTFSGDKFQLFAELSSRMFFGDELSYPNGFNNDTVGGYANNSIDIAPGLFFSYFPTSKFTVLVFAQHAQLLSLNDGYERDFTAGGLGAKYQLTDAINIEALYSNFLRVNNAGKGQSFNLGLRIII